MSGRGVRIGGGQLGGRTLEVASGVRPTEARVREALMHIWQPRLDGSRVLDLFAGSGAVAFEALGRGAAEATLVDWAPKVLQNLRRGCRELGLDSRCRIRRLHLPRGLERLEGPFDLVFADPPYDFLALDALVAGLPSLLAADGEAVVEHAARAEPAIPAGFVHQPRRYGDTVLSRLRRADGS